MKFRKALLAFCLLLSSAPSQSIVLDRAQFTTLDIVSGMTLDPSCLNYCITGICVWLRCTLAGCSIETSIKVSHYNPDVVVSVYDEGGGNPWLEAQSLYGAIEVSLAQSLTQTFHDSFAGGGQQTEGGSSAADNSLRFKEATVVGHPLSSISSFVGNGYYCPSEADSLVPYFSSSFDTLTWRLGLPEYLYIHNLIPGRRVVGDGIHQQWGPVWPRTGFIKQKDDAKAAAVIAQRAGNIVTQARQPHVYQQLNGNGYYKSWLPGELKENNERTGVWQMLSPRMDRQCYAFGENDVFSQSWSAGRNSEDNKYAFTLWRPYECCESQGLYLFTVPLQVCL
ncbi:TIGR03756 family integrating conjugative element protein [uncultured Pseudoteredinibacter sp.]|uniref:TIGR03756 family integrating conjugative element protein n=1 Tax=uncultured Pseudoteredinibacter sp. TaxID=1641701 RepID=UPI00260B71FA|nr:TIGR03756 family integrating conjugative element protein [uncultured Pseudoteredinibacter sp.]